MTEPLAAPDDPPSPPRRARLFAFLGPATLVAVGYMDPGNWATDLEGGARFGYQLLWVLVASNWVALLLQTLATRLGVAANHDLAQACRQAYSRSTGIILWILAEIAIIACDIAEVVGSAIALNLLFRIPLLWGAVITLFDVFVIMALQSRGMRTLEAIIVALIATVALCFAIEMIIIRPPIGDIAAGLMPRLSADSFAIAIGIVGATVMPHNLYLHSSTVRSREIEDTVPARKRALRFFLVDTTLALHVALFVNAAILILSAAVFGAHGTVVTDLREAHRLLTPLLGTSLAAGLFAVALLCSGQSSTITGALAGQIVMSGFLNLRFSPLVRRLLTRGLALVPAVGVIVLYGDDGLLPLLIGSQIILSLQLPFAIVPLIRLTSSPTWMGGFASGPKLRGAAWGCAGLISALNVTLVIQTLGALQAGRPRLSSALGCLLAAAMAFLGYITFVRLGHRRTGADDRLAKPDIGLVSGGG